MAITVASGSCLCGAVRVTAESFDTRVAACHCNMCRKWGGGPILSSNCGTEVRFEGEENITIYASSPWADRGFCKRCGTPLFYRVRESDHYFIPVDIFDDVSRALSLEIQTFIDRKPSYYSFSNRTQDLTGTEIFEMFAEK